MFEISAVTVAVAVAVGNRGDCQAADRIALASCRRVNDLERIWDFLAGATTDCRSQAEDRIGQLERSPRTGKLRI